MIHSYFSPLLQLNTRSVLFATPPLKVEHLETKWTKREQKCLRKCACILAKTGQQWGAVAYLKGAEHLHGRSPEECRARWEEHDRSPLTTKEQQKLAQTIEHHGSRGWEAIAAHVGEQATPYSCFAHYQRYNNKTNNNPSLGKRWELEEYTQLKQTVREFGTGDWGQVAQHIPTRNSAQSAAKWASTNAKKANTTDWTVRELKALLFAVKIYGERRWVPISQCIQVQRSRPRSGSGGSGSRTPLQCKEQWAVMKREMEGLEGLEGDTEEGEGEGEEQLPESRNKV